MMADAKTLPVDTDDEQPDSAVIVAATYKDPYSGALYVHHDMDAAQPAWAEEAHIGPPKADEKFGDVESWAAYVVRFGQPEALPFVTWNSAGLKAVLDYHGERGGGNRCQWLAAHPFEKSAEWKAWMALCSGQLVAQKAAVEKIEDLSLDVVDPAPGELMSLLRNLRSTVHATAQTELLPDGTTRVGFSQDKAVNSISDVSLPSEFTIAIPILRGHMDAAGKPVLYRLAVRLRATVDDQAHLALRFTIPLAERALEAVYVDRVALAVRLLGDGYSVLRAAG